MGRKIGIGIRKSKILRGHAVIKGYLLQQVSLANTVREAASPLAPYYSDGSSISMCTIHSVFSLIDILIASLKTLNLHD